MDSQINPPSYDEAEATASETDSRVIEKSDDQNPNQQINALEPEKAQQLKRARKAAKANITRKVNELNDLLKSVSSANVDRVKQVGREFEDVVEKFELAQETYHAQLTDEDDIQESDAYCEVERRRAFDLRERIAARLDNSVDKGMKENGTQELDEIRPRDSISNVGSYDSRLGLNASRKPKSKSSGESSVASSRSKASSRNSAVSARILVAAKRASLQAEAAQLENIQALENEEHRLRQRREKLKIETEIAKATAEERVYSEAEAVEREETLSRAFRLNERENSTRQRPRTFGREIPPEMPRDMPEINSTRKENTREPSNETTADERSQNVRNDRQLNPYASEWQDKDRNVSADGIL